MVNEQLLTLARELVAAVRGADFTQPQLKRLFVRVVPQLLAEIEILSAALSSGGLSGLEENPAPTAETPKTGGRSRGARRRQKRRGAKS
jgi:hypothetical protein